MGYASRAEIVAFLKALAQAERNGEPVADLLRTLLPKIRDDALYRDLKARLDRISEEKSAD
ncbi:MAG: hypothetical protein JOY64_16360 [Alphaproteobacteria bacterium]|nr:hypothetical protein [Alphaproteobacteria bacterium]MBV8409205.1 hypothetical protein [Alphaproteobacteria bacterium]